MLGVAERHPVLVREVIQSDGSRALGLRVFCFRQGRSLPLDHCRACPACVEVEDSCVRCTPTGDEPHVASAGEIVKPSVVCVRTDLDVFALPALFVELAMTSLLVVDESDRVVGLVRDSDLARPAGRRFRLPDDERIPRAVGQLASRVLPIDERTPVRSAISQMARSHLRQAPVVAADAELLGVLVDIDGLQWLATHVGGLS